MRKSVILNLLLEDWGFALKKLVIDSISYTYRHTFMVFFQCKYCILRFETTSILIGFSLLLLFFCILLNVRKVRRLMNPRRSVICLKQHNYLVRILFLFLFCYQRVNSGCLEWCKVVHYCELRIFFYSHTNIDILLDGLEQYQNFISCVRNETILEF